MSRRRRPFAAPADTWLEHEVEVRVRFDETDAMGVVWHGCYLSYFEDARCAFGRRYGFDYTDFFAHDLHAPLIHATIDHLAPARFGDVLAVRARLHVDDSARIDFTYLIRRKADAEPLVEGRTIQVFTTPAGELLMTRPPIYRALLERWGGALRR